ncbi:MAG: DNA polymerase III subunit beta, partial [Parasporobacterium sp.]|nr:DNA polymerase III subunit beta [Parasporobacterium sp.]
DIRDNEMFVDINSSAGYMNERMDIAKNGKDIMIGFNPKFIMDALRVIDDDEISIYMVNSNAPCFIRNEEGSYVYVILPVNIRR